jgi:putative ABC transport system ATP-binding protein
MRTVDEGAMVAVRGLTKQFGVGSATSPALRGVDLDVREGDFVALVGPSGSGKTTLLNLIGGLDAPSSGTVCLDGVELSALGGGDLEKLRLASMGFVFQAHNPLPVLTAVENVELVLALQKREPPRERRARSAEMLSRLGLGQKLHRLPSELSGGEQQRVAVARALVGRPRIVLADEPTASLDSAAASGLVALLRELNGTLGTTFLFSTHDPRIMTHARRMVTLQDGLVVSDERLS